MRVGMENIIVNFHCNQMSTKNVIVSNEQLFALNFFEKVL